MFEAGFAVADGVYSVVMIDAQTEGAAKAAREQHAQKHGYTPIYLKQITDVEVEERKAKGMPVIQADETTEELLHLLDQLNDESKRKFYKFLIDLTHRENPTTAPLTVLEAAERIRHINLLDSTTPTAKLYHDAIMDFVENEPADGALHLAVALAWSAGLAEGKRLDRQRRRK